MQNNIQDVEAKVREIIGRKFGIDEQVYKSMELRMGNPRQWDSLGHMQLIVELEKEFGVRFPIYAIAKLTTVPVIVQLICSQKKK